MKERPFMTKEDAKEIARNAREIVFSKRFREILFWLLKHDLKVALKDMKVMVRDRMFWRIFKNELRPRQEDAMMGVAST